MHEQIEAAIRRVQTVRAKTRFPTRQRIFQTEFRNSPPPDRYAARALRPRPPLPSHARRPVRSTQHQGTVVDAALGRLRQASPSDQAQKLDTAPVAKATPDSAAPDTTALSSDRAGSVGSKALSSREGKDSAQGRGINRKGEATPLAAASPGGAASEGSTYGAVTSPGIFGRSPAPGLCPRTSVPPVEINLAVEKPAGHANLRASRLIHFSSVLALAAAAFNESAQLRRPQPSFRWPIAGEAFPASRPLEP
jgi:hypothetical protein